MADPTKSQSRRWLFVCWTETQPLWDPDTCNFLVCGRETCPSTGRLHWQSYVEVRKKITRNGLRDLLGLSNDEWRAWPSNGSAEENIEYCLKERLTKPEAEWQDFMEGTPMVQGARSDLAALAQAITDGTTTVDEVVVNEPHAFHTYGRTLDRLQDVRTKSLTRGAFCPPTVMWRWGGTGLGKSRKSREEAATVGALYPYQYSDKDWQDRYRGEPCIIFDEFRASRVPFSRMLELLDGYEVFLPQRGRAPFPLMATHIWITSRFSPEECYNRGVIGDDGVDQLLRRITHIEHVTFNQY